MSIAGIDITQLIQILITVAAGVASRYLIPYLKRKAENEKCQKLMTWVRMGVKAAEQIYQEAGCGAKKKESVIRFLEMNNIKTDPDALQVMIEAAVHDIQVAYMQPERLEKQ